MGISAQKLVFFLGAFGIPFVLMVTNFVVRWKKALPYTAGSDFLFTEMSFGFASSVLWRDMSVYIRSPFIRKAGQAEFLFIGLLVFMTWLWTIEAVEPIINKAIRKRQKVAVIPQFKLFVAWALGVGFFALEVGMFLYR